MPQDSSELGTQRSRKTRKEGSCSVYVGRERKMIVSKSRGEGYHTGHVGSVSIGVRKAGGRVTDAEACRLRETESKRVREGEMDE